MLFACIWLGQQKNKVIEGDALRSHFLKFETGAQGQSTILGTILLYSAPQKCPESFAHQLIAGYYTQPSCLIDTHEDKKTLEIPHKMNTKFKS